MAREAGWLDRHVFFVPWVAAGERFGLYRESTVAVVLHRPRFEAEISMRTRVLDFLGAGLPVVATEGGTMSRLLAEEGMGRVVPEGDGAALTEALSALLASPPNARPSSRRAVAPGPRGATGTPSSRRSPDFSTPRASTRTRSATLPARFRCRDRRDRRARRAGSDAPSCARCSLRAGMTEPRQEKPGGEGPVDPIRGRFA